MQIDRLITFVFSHQTLIIEGIFATILSIIVIWLFANLQDENQAGSPIDSDDVKKMLEKALSEVASEPLPNVADMVTSKSGSPGGSSATATVTAPAVATSPPVATTPTKPTIISLDPAQKAPVKTEPAPKTQVEPLPMNAAVASPAPPNLTVSALKSDIENRNNKVDELEKALGQAREDLTKKEGSQASADALEELRKQIAILEGRLKEYAIIEDDIANLSAYKDENDKLKTELALLRKSKNLPLEPPTAPGPIGEVATESGPSWPINEGESKKLLNEFDTLMSKQTKSAAEEIIDQSKASDGEKLVAEFQNFMKGID